MRMGVLGAGRRTDLSEARQDPRRTLDATLPCGSDTSEVVLHVLTSSRAPSAKGNRSIPPQLQELVNIRICVEYGS
jgi:hypothetical protein